MDYNVNLNPNPNLPTLESPPFESQNAGLQSNENAIGAPLILYSKPAIGRIAN